MEWIGIAMIVAASSSPPQEPTDVGSVPTYVGSSACSGCHDAELAAWRGSSHAQAGGRVRPELVKGNFDGTRRDFASASFSPERTADGFAFRLDHYDAPLGVVGTLGRDLEQYLVQGPRGRLQALPMAFDVDRREWFDVFPEAPPPGDWSHWT